MSEPTTLFVGLDVHKDSIAVAHAQALQTDPPHYVGSIGASQSEIDKLVRRLHSKASNLVFAYEAGPCGYVRDRSVMPVRRRGLRGADELLQDLVTTG